MGTSKSPRRCRNCGHDRDWHDPDCRRCRHGLSCTYFRPPHLDSHAVIICHRDPRYAYDGSGTKYLRGSQWTRGADGDEAIEAERELCARGCGPGCLGRHTLVWFDGDESFTARLGMHEPVPDLADELRELYPKLRARGERKPHWRDRIPGPPCTWPTPDWANPPLERPPSALAQR